MSPKGGTTSNLAATSPNANIKETSSRTHLTQAHTWFASRPDFQMHKEAANPVADESEVVDTLIQHSTGHLLDRSDHFILLKRFLF